MRPFLPQAKWLLRRFAADSRAGISAEEFERLVSTYAELSRSWSAGAAAAPAQPAQGHRSAGRLRRAFQKYDKDRSGTIDAKELRPALSALGIKAGAKEAAAILSPSQTPKRAHDTHVVRLFWLGVGCWCGR